MLHRFALFALMFSTADVAGRSKPFFFALSHQKALVLIQGILGSSAPAVICTGARQRGVHMFQGDGLPIGRDTLLKISPVLLAKLFQHLGSGMLPTQPCLQARLFPLNKPRCSHLPFHILD